MVLWEERVQVDCVHRPSKTQNDHKGYDSGSNKGGYITRDYFADVNCWKAILVAHLLHSPPLYLSVAPTLRPICSWRCHAFVHHALLAVGV